VLVSGSAPGSLQEIFSDLSKIFSLPPTVYTGKVVQDLLAVATSMVVKVILLIEHSRTPVVGLCGAVVLHRAAHIEKFHDWNTFTVIVHKSPMRCHAKYIYYIIIYWPSANSLSKFRYESFTAERI
jgi:hypothetical protein